MHLNHLPLPAHAAVLFLGLGVAAISLAAETSGRFGFTGPEIFPVDNFITHLRSGDLDGDGRIDLVVVNNARSKLNLLYNRTGLTNENQPTAPRARRELNELLPDARFRIDSIASEKRISALTVADLNSDGRPDLVYFGEPKELIVQYNLGDGNWGTARRIPLDDGLLDMNALTNGDLNGDGREDLAMLGEGAVHFMAQKADQTLAEPVRIPYTGTVKAIQILDIDGDGRSDLLLVNWDNPNPFRFRLQTRDGHLGPEVHFTLPPIRSYWADDLDGDRKTEIITIAQKSGRAQISNFVRQDAELLGADLREGQFAVLPMNKTTRNRRGVVWADVNGDQLPDLLVAEPDSGQLTVHFQQPDGGLAARVTFPTFTGVIELAVADWDGDGRPEIFFLSFDERQIGVSRLDDQGGMAFPTLVPVEGRPLAMTAGRVQRDGPSVLAVVTDVDGKRELVLREADGKSTRQKLGESFKGNPSAIVMHDADHDDLTDLIILVPYEKVKVLLQVAGQPFDEQDLAPPGGSAEQPWVSAADVDGDGRDELLLAQKNFLRAVVATPDPAVAGSTNKPAWSFQVKEQINGAGSNSRIVAAAAVPSGTNRALLLLDAERKGITLCERNAAGVWQAGRTVTIPVTDFASMVPLRLGGTEVNAVTLVGLNSVGLLQFTGQVWALEEFDSYETPIKDGYLHDVVSGDLNNDGRRDLVFLETGRNHLDLVTLEPPNRLVPADRWQVFEERTFRNRRSEIPEPREALIADLDGDGRNDLVVLVHDRILLYPQD